MAPHPKPIVAVTRGQRVTVQTTDGLKTGTVEQVDDTTFPGKVYVRDDDGVIREVLVHIGFAD